MNKKLRITLIIFGAVLATALLGFGGFIIYMNVMGARGGETVKFSAKKIGKTAYQEEKTIKINNHEFTYYNVKSANDGGWILVDNTSYIINTDIAFGFRYQNAELVSISIYGGASNEPRYMGQTDSYPGYSDYQVYGGFKLSIKENVNYADGINVGVLIHWC